MTGSFAATKVREELGRCRKPCVVVKYGFSWLCISKSQLWIEKRFISNWFPNLSVCCFYCLSFCNSCTPYANVLRSRTKRTSCFGKCAPAFSVSCIHSATFQNTFSLIPQSRLSDRTEARLPVLSTSTYPLTITAHSMFIQTGMDPNADSPKSISGMQVMGGEKVRVL